MRHKHSILIFFVTVSPFFLKACSSADKFQHYDALKYLTAKTSDRYPAQEFEEALSREVYLAGGNYHIVAFPYTHAYLTSLVEEQAKLKGLSSIEKKETLKRLTENYITKKTCFKFRYAVLRFNEVGQLKDWQVTYFNNQSINEALTWESNPKRDPSFADSNNPLDDLHEKWLGDGIACTSKSLDLTQSFGLKVRPQYVQFPFDSYGDLFWDLNASEHKLRHQETNL